MEWQSIETAPKDGTWFLAYGERLDESDMPPYGLARWVVRIVDRWEYASERHQTLVTKDESGWDYETAGVIAYPTDWAPFLAPPTTIPKG